MTRRTHTTRRTPTLLEELVRTRTAHTMTEAHRIAIEQIAIDIAKEALADEDFRRELRALVQQAAREIMASLARPADTTNGRGRRSR